MKKEVTIRTNIQGGDYDFISLKPNDIKKNTTIFFFNEESEEMIPVVINEIYNLDDEFKTFSIDECEYGIDCLYQMKYY